MVVNALKNLANELNLFVWTGTQFNKNGMDDEFITENCLRGRVTALKYLILVAARGYLKR